MIFQSLGSNYSFGDALNLLFGDGSTRDAKNLTAWLEKRYGGTAILYDKGRDALSAAISALDSPRVAVNGMTCSVVVEATLAGNAPIVYLDVESDGHFSAATLEAAFASDTPPTVVIVQNTYGHACDITAIEKLVREHDALLIEDLAHSLGQTYADGREAGTVGDIVMFSFGRDKIVDVVNAGALIVRDKELLETVKRPQHDRPFSAQLRDRLYPLLSWTARRTYSIGFGKFIITGMYRLHLAEHSADGGIHPEYGLPHWQARQLLRQLDRLDTNLTHRRKIAHIYEELLPDLIAATDSLVRVPLHVENREEILTQLAKAGFYLSDTWYDTPIGPRRKYKSLDYPVADHPRSIALADHVINLPTHREMTPALARQIAAIIKETQ